MNNSRTSTPKVKPPRTTELSHLFTQPCTLADIPPEFEGMSFALWHNLTLSKQAEERRATLPDPEPRRQWTKRDDYGYKSA